MPPLDNDPLYEGDYRAEFPTTQIHGLWTDPSFTSYGETGHRGWVVAVARGVSPRIRRVVHAANRYETDLGYSIDAAPRSSLRFRHKHFVWGEAVSFLVQYQNDNTNGVPNNGMLFYEVYGLTRDGRYTVRARFGVTHPRLKRFGPAGAFQLGIDADDAMLETLRPGES